MGWVLASDGSQLIEIAGIAASPRAGRAIDLPSAARRFWTSPDANAVILRLDTGIFLLRSGDQLEQVAEGIAVTAVWDRASTGFALCWAEKNPPVPDLRMVIGPGTTNIPVDITLSKSYSLPITGDLVLTSEANTGASDGEVNKPDPAVQLLPGGRRTRFEIPAGTRSARVRLASLGTVAAQHRISVERLTIAGKRR